MARQHEVVRCVFQNPLFAIVADWQAGEFARCVNSQHGGLLQVWGVQHEEARSILPQTCLDRRRQG